MKVSILPYCISLLNSNISSMTKKLILILISLGLIISCTPAQAATNPKVVAKAFNSLLQEATKFLVQIEEKFKSDSTQAESELSSAIDSLKSSYSASVLKLSSEQQNSRNIIDLEIPKFNAVNEVEFMTSSYTFKGWRFWFDCAKQGPTCGDDNQSYPFKIGDRVKTRPAEPENLFPVTYWEDLAAKGVVKFINPAAFQTSAAILKTEILNWYKKDDELKELKTSGKSKLDKQIDDLNLKHIEAIENIQAKYEVDAEEPKLQKLVAQIAALATKSASKDQSAFEAAFRDAFIFEFNRHRLNQISNEPWTGNWSYKSIDSRLEVKKLSLKADSISKRYSRITAVRFNSELGQAFVNEPSFKAAVELLTTTYKQATARNLKF